MNKEHQFQQIQDKSEELFRSVPYFCSEAVIQTINDALNQPFHPDVVKMASGFPIGLGKDRLFVRCCIRRTDGTRHDL